MQHIFEFNYSRPDFLEAVPDELKMSVVGKMCASNRAVDLLKWL